MCRLDRMVATTVMIMEAFNGFGHKFDYSIVVRPSVVLPYWYPHQFVSLICGCPMFLREPVEGVVDAAQSLLCLDRDKMGSHRSFPSYPSVNHRRPSNSDWTSVK